MKRNCYLKVLLSVIIIFFLTSYTNKLKATNPVITNQIINLSEGITEYNIQDISPEIVIDGNTVHVIWIQFRTKLFYCRSLDLGETLEEPKLIHETGGLLYQSDTRRLAVENAIVHFAIAFNETMMYYRSTNNGETFDEPVTLAEYS